MKKIKILVAHPGKQHSMKLVEALNEIDYVSVKYMTSVYDKKHSILMKIIKFFSSADNIQRANNRKSKNIDDDQVVLRCSISGLFRIFLAHYDRKKRLFHKMNIFISKKFGRSAAKYAIKNGFDVIICYDTFSSYCFRYLKNHNSKIIKVIDASAANLAYQKNIFENEIKINPDFAEKLLSEIGYTLNKKNQKEYIYEAKEADYVISASRFTSESFIQLGTNKDNIFLCPYGLNYECYKNTYDNKNFTDKVNFVFLGGTKQSKGLSYVLNSFEKLDHKKCSLMIVGNDDLEDKYKNQYNDVIFLGLKLHSEIPDILFKSDILLFPSLSDGFGFAAAEGMAAGLPIIVSDNSGISDYVIDYKNGFTVHTSSTQELYNKMNWFINNSDKISCMGKNARETIIKLNNENYNQSIKNAIDNIILNIEKGRN